MTNDLGDEPSDEDSVLAILKTFYATDKRPWIDCITEFNKLVTESYNKPIKLNLDFENKQAEYFIIADTYLSQANIVSLYNHLSGNNKKDISISFAKRVKFDFLSSVEHFKEKYEWIYNPPTIGKMGKYTIGKQLRNEFQEHYGAYAEITYLLSGGNALKFDEVNKMPLNEYLSLGEYLIRKRAVEGVEWITTTGKITINDEVKRQESSKVFRDSAMINTESTHFKNIAIEEVFQTYTVNTGVLDESMNALIEELIYSPNESTSHTSILYMYEGIAKPLVEFLHNCMCIPKVAS